MTAKLGANSTISPAAENYLFKSARNSTRPFALFIAGIYSRGPTATGLLP
jgi:hypothetical protein